MEKQLIYKADQRDNFSLNLLFLYIVMKPFYFLQSGGLQIADVFLICLFIFLLINPRGFKIQDWVTLLFLLALFFVITAVSGIWTIITEDLAVLMPILFLLFNLFLFLCASHIINTNPNAKKYILWAVMISVFLQCLLIPISFTPTFRQSLFFNNPNQLGYWSVLCASLFLFLVQDVKINKYVYVAFTGTVIMLAGLSLSKAAMLAIFILYFVYYGGRPIVALFFMICLIGVFIFGSEIEQVSNVIDRLSDLGSAGDDNASGRGYNRIWERPDFAWLGQGEGALDRFGESHEIHSTVGTLFFSYGPIGLFIFLAIFIRFVFTKGIVSVLPFIPVFAYSLTHQGFRFSLFWLLLSLVSTFKNENEIKKDKAVAQIS
jgi:hypothetical protein